MNHQLCPLCNTENRELFLSQCMNRDFYLCNNCKLISVPESQVPSHEEELERYELHQNDNSNLGYIRFLNQILIKTKPFLNTEMQGLDFGSGPNPVLANLLNKDGYSCDIYDPFYYPKLPESNYDFIFSTECFEHFFNPRKEMILIDSLLKPGGILAIMTDVWSEEVDFKKWYYIRDFTHVSFYHFQTMKYMESAYHLELIATDLKRCFVFRKKG